MRDWWIVLAGVSTIALAGWAGRRFWPGSIDLKAPLFIPTWAHTGNTDALTLPGRCLVAELATYDDEFFAYLMYRYLGGAPGIKGHQLLLTYERNGDGISYSIRMELPNELLSSISTLAALKARGTID